MHLVNIVPAVVKITLLSKLAALRDKIKIFLKNYASKRRRIGLRIRIRKRVIQYCQRLNFLMVFK